MESIKNHAVQFFKQHKKAVIAIGAILTLAALKNHFSGGKCKVDRDLTDKVIVITGGSAGIGKATVEALASKRCLIIIGARDEAKAQALIKKIKQKNQDSQIIFFPLDLGDKTSVEQFSQRVKEVCDCVNILINNAGLIALGRQQDKNGFQKTMGTNHLGHFYLTYCLWELVKKSDKPRIITVSSAGHAGMNLLAPVNLPLRFDDMNLHHNYDWKTAYCRSKVANILFARQLQLKMDEANIEGRSVSVHPGAIMTDIARDLGTFTFVFKKLLLPITLIVFKSEWQGAQTTLYTVLEDFDKLEKGQYYSDCKKKETTPYCRNMNNAQRLWKVSEEMLGIVFKV